MRIRPLRLTVAAVALAALASGGGLLWRVLDTPKPTAFSWPATMTTVAGGADLLITLR